MTASLLGLIRQHETIASPAALRGIAEQHLEREVSLSVISKLKRWMTATERRRIFGS